MYEALLFIHVASAFLYFLLHGGVASVTLVLAKQRHREAGQALESILDLVYPAAPVSLGVTVLSGVILGFVGRWWRWGWIWTSLGLLGLIWIVMATLGNRHLDRHLQRLYTAEGQLPPDLVSDTDVPRSKKISAILERNRAAFLTAIGVAGLIAILWLMMSKPF